MPWLNIWCQPCLPHMHAPSSIPPQAVKTHFMIYQGTFNFDMRLLSQSSTRLYAFCDADAGYPDRSITGQCMFIGSNCVSWRWSNLLRQVQCWGQRLYYGSGTLKVNLGSHLLAWHWHFSQISYILLWQFKCIVS